MRIPALLALAAALAACSSQPATTPTPSPSPLVTAAPTPTALPTAEATASATASGDASPTIDLRPFLTATLTLINLAETTLTVTATFIDTSEGSESTLGTFEAASLQATTQSLPPGRYRLDFTYGSTLAGTCTLDVAENNAFQFAAITRGVAITRSGVEPTDPDEVLVATSSLCRAGGAP
jgi:hypothetical protein